MATREPKPFIDFAEGDFDLAYQVGPRATFFLMQAAYPHLLAARGGAIINFGSGSGTTSSGSEAAVSSPGAGMGVQSQPNGGNKEG